MRTKNYIKLKRSRYIESNAKKQKRLLFSASFLVVVIMLSGAILIIQLSSKLSTQPNSTSPVSPNESEQITTDDASLNKAEQNVKDTSLPNESDTSEPQNPPTPSPEREDTSTESRPSTAEGPFPVTYIADGDTFHINYYGVETSLRLIGVDTPETVDRRTTVQCFGIEASNYLKSKLTGQQVYIESDPTQSDRDGYNRLLRYAYLGNEDIGLSIIANGYGHEYTYYIPYQKQSKYQAAERNAEVQNLGLWSPSTCGGVTR